MALLESKTMPQGEALPPFRLQNYDGFYLRSEDFISSKLLLIVFTCNHCPYAKVAWPILIELQKKYQNNKLQVIAINPNNNPNYPDDSFEEMKRTYVSQNLNFPYLFDEDQSVAKLYNAVCTPDPFLFRNDDLKGDFKLFYHGRFNDNWKEPQKVKENSMDLFIQDAIKGKLVGVEVHPRKVYPSMGCSIKWV